MSRLSSPTSPMWFIAHGGPMTLYDTKHPAHQHWLKIANDIRNQQPPLKGIVFISAHWQADRAQVSKEDMGVLVNVDQANPMLYDYYNFPQKLYELTLKTENPPWLSSLVKSALEEEGLPVFPTQRGIDHGVFIPLLAGFGEQGTGLPPLVQISLPPEDIDNDPSQDGLRALKLGMALRGLRSKGIAIVGGGQPVHNLRDFMRARQLGQIAKGPYTVPFSKALTEVITPVSVGTNEQGEPSRWDAARKLFQHEHYSRAHPSSEHLLPALVNLGAAYDDEEGEEQFAMTEGSLAWNMFKWAGRR